MAVERFAPAKVNLFLHVGHLGDDGYHPICSLMAFADIGDVVSLENTAALEVEIRGPFGADLPTDGANLMVRARDAAMAAFDLFDDTFRLTLDKRLPIASGLGGGSSDAAATLLAMAAALNFEWDDADGEPLEDIARTLGADVLACLKGDPVLAQGRGDELSDPFVFPDLDVVLANPGATSATGAVYATYDAFGAPGGDDLPPWPEPLETAQEAAAFLARCRNDLEGPAISLQPLIGEVLRTLREQPESLLARMSGSGATCFAICRSGRDARDLETRLSLEHPAWWVKRCRLTGFHP